MTMKNSAGFTLIELMITVAIMSILLTVGLPSFQSIIIDSRLTATANAMLSAYQLARSEGLKQHKDVYVLTTDSWETWQVKVKAAAEPFATFSNSKKITITPYGDVGGYGANGRTVTATGSQTSCNSSNSTPPTCGFTFKNADGSSSRTLNIVATGRTKVSTP